MVCIRCSHLLSLDLPVSSAVYWTIYEYIWRRNKDSKGTDVCCVAGTGFSTCVLPSQSWQMIPSGGTSSSRGRKERSRNVNAAVHGQLRLGSESMPPPCSMLPPNISLPVSLFIYLSYLNSSSYSRRAKFSPFPWWRTPGGTDVSVRKPLLAFLHILFILITW